MSNGTVTILMPPGASAAHGAARGAQPNASATSEPSSVEATSTAIERRWQRQFGADRPLARSARGSHFPPEWHPP